MGDCSGGGEEQDRAPLRRGGEAQTDSLRDHNPKDDSELGQDADVSGNFGGRDFGQVYGRDGETDSGAKTDENTAEGKDGDGRADTHETGSHADEEGGGAGGALAAPAVHEHIAEQASCETASGEDGGYNGELEVRHGETSGEAIEGVGAWVYFLAGQDGLDLVEDRDVVAKLRVRASDARPKD